MDKNIQKNSLVELLYKKLNYIYKKNNYYVRI